MTKEGDVRTPFIELQSPMPGMAALMEFKPEWGRKLGAFAQEILRGSSSLSPGEREVIAAFVSAKNDTYFCAHSHAAVARELLNEDVGRVIDSIDSAPVSDKMRALLAIADKVRRSGLDVTEADIAAARDSGASDEDIHDTVLVAAAFCCFNRYVDGLRAPTPRDAQVYDGIGRLLSTQGYAREA